MRSERKNQWQALTAHQSKSEEVGYEFQEYIFTLAAEENRKIFDEGMIKDRVENLNMSVYVRTISGKTFSIKCDRRQKCNKNNGNRAIDPKRPTVSREPGKC